MKFVYYSNLTPAAKEAFDRCDNSGRFVVDSGAIAVRDEQGRPQDFVKVLKCNSVEFMNISK